jgi:hypothetical protein
MGLEGGSGLEDYKEIDEEAIPTLLYIIKPANTLLY